MQMPDMNGLEVLSCLSKDEDGPAVVFLTASATDQQLVAAVAGGARGIILKDAAADTLLDCLHTVARGGRWVPQLLISAASEREAARHAGVARIDIVLTPRERELLLLVAEGLSNKEIARRLNLTEGTVKIHLHNAYQKLDVTNRTSMAALVLSYRNQSNR
jgi:RNA polymerase sigma factor (sigma-70 family)